MFRQDFTCPALLKDLCSLSRTGLSPTMGRLPRRFRYTRTSHWPGPLSLATTRGVSVDVHSSGYLDVSVRRVCLITLCIQVIITLMVYLCFRHSTAHSHHPAQHHQLSKTIKDFCQPQAPARHPPLGCAPHPFGLEGGKSHPRGASRSLRSSFIAPATSSPFQGNDPKPTRLRQERACLDR